MNMREQSRVNQTAHKHTHPHTTTHLPPRAAVLRAHMHSERACRRPFSPRAAAADVHRDMHPHIADENPAAAGAAISAAAAAARGLGGRRLRSHAIQVRPHGSEPRRDDITPPRLGPLRSDLHIGAHARIPIRIPPSSSAASGASRRSAPASAAARAEFASVAAPARAPAAWRHALPNVHPMRHIHIRIRRRANTAI